MRKFSALIFVIMFPAIALAGPKIVFEAETHEFPQTIQGHGLTHVFVFENKGDEDLVIVGVQSS